jgi:hypothetical protein
VRGARDTTVCSIERQASLGVSLPNRRTVLSVGESMTVNLINGKMSGIVKEKLMFILHAICVQMTHLSTEDCVSQCNSIMEDG